MSVVRDGGLRDWREREEAGDRRPSSSFFFSVVSIRKLEPATVVELAPWPCFDNAWSFGLFAGDQRRAPSPHTIDQSGEYFSLPMPSAVL